MRWDPLLGAMANRPDQQIHAFQTAEGPLHLCQALVAAHRIGRRDLLGRFAGTNHVDPIQLRFLRDRLFPPRPAQLAILNGVLKVLAHLVSPQHLAHTRPGLQFGSALVSGEVLDWLPGTMLGRVRNLREFAGLLAFDKWTGNADGRQVVFHKEMRERKYAASFIDFGYCFNAGEWSFPDAPLRGVYGLNDVYERIESWDDFDPWLSRIERFSERQLHSIADEIPCEWYGERAELRRLLDCLLDRRSMVRQLIEDFRTSSRNPFPNWTAGRPALRATEVSMEPLVI